MASESSQAAQATELVRGSEGLRGAGAEALPSGAHSADHSPSPFGLNIGRLPVELEVAVPLRDFRVRSLLALEPGQVIESQWENGDDLPLSAGEVQLAWIEFEVIDTRLAGRVTRLA